jgi:excisionase family DNA binding protein
MRRERLLRQTSEQQPASPRADSWAPENRREPAAQTPAKLLLRPLEAAAALGVGRSTVYELMRSGELPVVHIGRAVRIPSRALEHWVARQATSVQEASVSR